MSRLKISYKAALALTCATALSACQTSGPDGILSNILPKKEEKQQIASISPNTGTNPNAKPALKNTRNALSEYCPAVRIRAGTESYRIYKGKDRENPDNIRYQATLTKVARECVYSGDQLEIKVGALGRVITGPSGKAGSFDMPIRVAVQEGGCSRHFKLHRQAASVPEGATNSSFQFVDNTIVMPRRRQPMCAFILALMKPPTPSPARNPARRNRNPSFGTAERWHHPSACVHQNCAPSHCSNAAMIGTMSTSRLATVSAPASVNVSEWPL